MDFPNNPNQITNARLKELLELTRENNVMLKKIRRATIFSSILRFIYWAIILGAAFGTYYYLQPYLETLFETYKTILGTAGLFQGL